MIEKQHNKRNAPAEPGLGREALSVWFAAPRTVEIRQSNTSAPAPGEVLVESIYSGISHGTEMLVYRGEVPSEFSLDLSLPTCRGDFGFPVKYGYASVGRVVEAGSDARDIGTGDIVFAYNPHETCYSIARDFVVKLPNTVSPKSGVFVANMETAINAMLDTSPRLGETVLVIGQGIVGLLITALARKAGAGLIITADLFEKRRALSLALGADVSVDASAEDISARVNGLTGGTGADVVIESSGQPATLDDAIGAAAAEARIVVVSWYGARRAPLALGADFHRKRLVLMSSQVSSINPSLAPRWTVSRRRELAVRYLSEIPCDTLISHTIPFARAAEAYRLIDEDPGEVVQVVLEYNR